VEHCMRLSAVCEFSLSRTESLAYVCGSVEVTVGQKDGLWAFQESLSVREALIAAGDTVRSQVSTMEQSFSTPQAVPLVS